MSDSTTLPPPDALVSQLQARLPSFGYVSWVEQIGSTNADLLTRARRLSGGKPWLLGAHLQQTGRGRAGRAWQNRPGAALMFSCAFDTSLPGAGLPALSPLAGLVACEALRELAGPAGKELCVKWPNDVQWGEAKLAGVLVETARNIADRRAGHTVVIGMGTNLTDASALSQALDRPIADWAGVGANVPIVDVICAVAQAWQRAITELEQNGFQSFVERFAHIDALAGRAVQVLDQGTAIQSGVAKGVDEQGRLLVQTGSGLVPVSVGEISVRPT
jgi:BirA family biotin operon repressor/biotin-[acetyl-CoA-carboxylase] ligase